MSRLAPPLGSRNKGNSALDMDLLSAAVAAAPVSISVVGRDGKLIYTNQAIKQLSGFKPRKGTSIRVYEAGHILRRPDGSLYQPDEFPVWRALAHGEIVRGEEMTCELPDGGQLVMLVHAAPIRSASGEITSAMLLIQDLARVRYAESISNDFLAMVSHELKTPLAAIKGSSLVLRDSLSEESAPIRVLADEIDEETDRLGGLVDNLLDMTQIQAGTFSVQIRPVDFGSLLKEASILYQRSGHAQELVIQPLDTLVVYADRQRIIQVLTNLLSNSSKWSPSNESIDIWVERAEDEATVHVRDKGQGISRKDLPNVFNKFHKGEPLGEGAGLGLAICKGIIDAHGGRIWAASLGRGHGATLSFTLQRVSVLGNADLPNGVAGQNALDNAPITSAADIKARILAGNNDVRFLRFIRRTFSEAGYEVGVASGGEAIGRAIESDNPDLVLLDSGIGAGGSRVVQQIRESSSVPIIVIGESRDERDAIACLRAGADDYVAEMISPSELLARVDAVLRRHLFPERALVRKPFLMGDLKIDFATRAVVVGEKVIPLTPTEYKLLALFANSPGRILTHDEIAHGVWGPEYSGASELIRSTVRNLRRKLSDEARNPRFIRTESTIGYRLLNP